MGVTLFACAEDPDPNHQVINSESAAVYYINGTSGTVGPDPFVTMNTIPETDVNVQNADPTPDFLDLEDREPSPVYRRPKHDTSPTPWSLSQQTSDTPLEQQARDLTTTTATMEYRP